MKKEEFLNQLENLLMDIPEGDRLDAIEYYDDYFGEAGVENEQKVIQELGSPEKVARTIKENLGLSGQRTSRDYSAPEDYEEPRGFEESRTYERTKAHEESRTYEQSRSYEQSRGYENTHSSESSKEKRLSYILIVIIAILTFPLWIGIVAGLFGGLVGLLGGMFGIAVGLLGAGFGLSVGGIACVVTGIFRAAISPVEGVITIGVGAILAALGILIALLFAWLVIKWIPALFRTIINWCKGLFHRNEGGNEI